MKKKSYFCFIITTKKINIMSTSNLTIEQIRAMEPGREKWEAYNNYKNRNKSKSRFTTSIRSPKIKK